MKKLLLCLAMLLFTIGVVLFIGCQKSKSSENDSPEKSIQLVPLDSARNIAARFNPSVFFDASNSSNHSPF